MLKKVIFFSVSASLALANSIEFDEIVVTATGFEGKLSDEVRNVYVLGENEIQERGYRSIKEALEKIPSVEFINTGGIGNKIDMRGQGARANTAVKVLINGVPMNMIDSAHGIVPYEMIAIEDVERIEAMPGGGAVLYGSGTRGGVVNIITKRTPRDFYANIGTKWGSYDYKDFTTNVGGNASENLFLKFGAKVFDTDGYTRDFHEKGYFLNGTMDWQISENQSLFFMPSFYKGKINSPFEGLTLAQVLQDRRANPYPGFTGDEDMKRVDLTFDYKAKIGDNFTLNVLPYYQRVKIKNNSDFAKAYGSPYLAYKTNGLFGDTKYGLNIKTKFDYDSGELVLGYDYILNKGDRESHTFYKVDMGRMQMSHHIDTVLGLDKTTHAFYFMEKQEFGDKFDLNFGARFERAKFDITRNTAQEMSATIPNPAMNTKTNAVHTQKSNQNNYALEITPNFNYSSSGNIYAKFERGYVSPSPNQLTDKNPTTKEYSFNGIDSEVYKTYEIGLKDEIFGSFVSATLFYTDSKDEIIEVMLGGHGDGWEYYNLDKTRRYGAELFASQKLFDKFSISESYSFVDSKIKEGNNAGKEVPFVSKHKFVLGASYEPIKNLKFWSDVKYYSKKFDSYYERIPAKTIVDAGFNYKFANGFSVGAGVKNLFNKKYYEAQSVKQDSYYPANERNYYAEFKYDF
ncbi:MAG: TonB-dependent receptor [Campylobacter sp.]|nr:TonB-dependent receptor [Campylobacter sp.]